MPHAATAGFATWEALAAAFRAHVAPGKLDFYEALGMRLTMGRREGVHFEDAYTGRRFVNCHSNGGVFNLGHRHPGVVAAVRDALEVLDIGNHHLPSGLRALLARRLVATTGGRLERVVFGVAGGEVADVAIKVARGRTGRRRIVSVLGGYHGHTGLALATGDARFRDPFGENLPHFAQVPFDDVAAMERAVDADTAAVVLEAVPATLGMPIPRPGYFAEVRRLTSERGALLVIDEIQTGLGRTGTHWGYEHEGIVPDAILTGKGLGGGVYPISAVVMTADMHAALDAHPFAHISTFGGAEPGCVAALAVLDVVEAPDFLARVRRLSDHFAGAFAELPFELRRRGLFMGMKFGSEAEGIDGFRHLLDAGVFAFPAGNDPSVVQFLPPLVIGDADVDDLVLRVRGAFT